MLSKMGARLADAIAILLGVLVVMLITLSASGLLCAAELRTPEEYRTFYMDTNKKTIVEHVVVVPLTEIPEAYHEAMRRIYPNVTHVVWVRAHYCVGVDQAARQVYFLFIAPVLEDGSASNRGISLALGTIPGQCIKRQDV